MADTEARWYCVSAQGLPMLCASKEDAEREAKRNDKEWPTGAPHRAAQLCDAAERDRLRAQVEQQADSIESLMEQSERRKEYADRLRADVRELVECLGAILQPGETGTSILASAMARKRGLSLMAKHSTLQALADNAREMGMTYEDGSKT